jgi:hypothetical protein
MRRETDAAGEGLGDLITMTRDVANLAAGQPQSQACRQQDGGGEDEAEGEG